MTNRIFSPLVLLTIALMSGCGASAPTTFPVTGIVTMNQKPLGKVRVHFIPQSGTLGQGGDGVTDEKGRYEILAYPNRKTKGLVPGNYKIVLTRKLRPDGTPPPMDVEDVQSGGAKETIPEPYCNPRDTPFTNPVEPRDNAIDFPL